MVEDDKLAMKKRCVMRIKTDKQKLRLHLLSCGFFRKHLSIEMVKFLFQDWKFELFL